MRIPDLYARPEPAISFELFPPKTDQDEQTLFADTVPALKRLRPAYFSMTCGAGGGSTGAETLRKTLRLTDCLRQGGDVEAVAHLTCVTATRTGLGRLLDEARALGIENVLALRGDPPRDQPDFKPLPDGFAYAADLVRFIRAGGYPFTIGVAGYPEGHAECPDRQLDWDRTIAKVAAGADFLITQLFYDLDDYLAFETYLRNKGVRVPIIPGILPFLSGKQIKGFATRCGARLPQQLLRQIDQTGDDAEAGRRLGVEVCTDLCRRLLAHGVPGFHFYCLNRYPSCAEVLRNLGLA